MPRIGFLVASLCLIANTAARAQDDERVYVAYYQVGWGDLLEWIGLYRENSVPVLEALVEEGVITGFGAHMHSTGGEYNFRQSIRGTADTDFQAFWNQYLARTGSRNAAGSERASRMIMAHYDEVWNIDQVNIPDGGTSRYLYDAQFQVNFADLEEWNRMWDETFGPALAQAVTDGLIVGWVEESHNTGGRFNWKLINLVDDWDHIDELTESIFQSAPLDHPIWDLFTAHMDEVWEQLPPPSAN